MLDTAKLLPEDHFIINIPHQLEEETQKIIDKYDIDIKIMKDNYYEAVLQCKYALVASGTATLEAALLKVPFAIIYKLNPLTFFIMRTIIKIKYIGLPNIFLERLAFKEFIQNAAKPVKIREHIEKEMNDDELQKRIEDQGDELYKILGTANLKFGVKKILELMEDSNV